MVGSLRLFKQQVNEIHQLKGREDYIPETALRISSVRQAARLEWHARIVTTWHLGPLLTVCL